MTADPMPGTRLVELENRYGPGRRRMDAGTKTELLRVIQELLEETRRRFRLDAAALIGQSECGTMIGAGDTPRFVCTLEPHDGHVHANPAAVAWLLADGKGWAIESGRIPDPHTGVLKFRDCMGNARALNATGALPTDGRN